VTDEPRERAICELEDLLARIDELALESLSTPAFLQWKGETEAVIHCIFGSKSREASMFAQVRYTPLTHAACLSDDNKVITFQRGLAQARFVLQSMIQRVQRANEG
jgi:hypothetical protein